jgi:molybdenum storage protein
VSYDEDQRPHLQSMLMRESLLDKEVMKATGAPVVRMLGHVHVVKIGGGSLFDHGREAVYPLVKVLETLLEDHKLIIAVGGGVRSRHLFSIGLDLGLPTGVLAQLSEADSLGNAHMLGTLLASKGVVAIPPEMFGHLLPLFLRGSPGVIYSGVPPYSLWEHPPELGKIPPHRTDAGCFLMAECFGTKSLTLVKDVDGVYAEDPHKNPDATFYPKLSVSQLEEMNLATLPFERVLLELLPTARLARSFQIVNGLHPERVAAAVRGEHVGTIVYADG